MMLVIIALEAENQYSGMENSAINSALYCYAFIIASHEGLAIMKKDKQIQDVLEIS